MPAQPQQVLVYINEAGETEIEVVGASGKSCTALTLPLEQALGKVEGREFKPEYRQSDVTVSQQLRQRS